MVFTHIWCIYLINLKIPSFVWCSFLNVPNAKDFQKRMSGQAVPFILIFGEIWLFSSLMLFQSSNWSPSLEEEKKPTTFWWIKWHLFLGDRVVGKSQDSALSVQNMLSLVSECLDSDGWFSPNVSFVHWQSVSLIYFELRMNFYMSLHEYSWKEEQAISLPNLRWPTWCNCYNFCR